MLCIYFSHQVISKINEAAILYKNKYQGHENVSFNLNSSPKYNFLQKITNHFTK